MSSLKRCFDLLSENEAAIHKDVCEVLLRLCRNVVKYPSEPKYRKVRLSNPIVAQKILPAVGAMECLFEIGFVERDDHLLLPENASLAKLRELQLLLSEPQVEKAPPAKSMSQKTGPVTQPATLASRPATSLIYPTPSTGLQPITNSPVKEATFFQQIRGHFQDVLRYENAELQKRTRAVVPLVDLEIAAMEQMRLIQRDVKSKGDKSLEDISMEDLVFAQVLKWFKEKFFKWVDSPECSACAGKCSFQAAVPGKRPGVSRIEIHRCTVCATTVEFPRYSDPALLLHSRKGRCGEWANMFALICRSLGYDTRLIWDYTDHVWVEIWSLAAKRWIHADPCENTMDRPLLYEKGWGKKLSYVLAFSKDEIQDVTWRYTSNQTDVMTRRRLCSEQSLLSFITSLTENRRRTSCSLLRQQYLIKRSLMELVELITCHFGTGKKNENDKEYQGRTSGSLAWRLARHETNVDSQSSHTWRIPAAAESIRLTYTASSDEYIFVDNSGKVLDKKEGWAKGVYETDGGVFRKVESDWKMVYLARGPENECGKIQWNFEIHDTNLEIGKFNFHAVTAVFNGASVEWKLQGFYRSGKTRVISINDSKEFETEQLNGTFKISLQAVLSGGDKDLAWQHAQLFRQSLEATEHSMQINITLSRTV